MGLMVVAYTAGLVLQSIGWSPVVDGWLRPVVDNWLGLLTVWVPAGVCWLAVARGRFRRWEGLIAAAGVTFFALGDTYYVVMLAGAGALPFPSPGDALYLLFYPLMLAALVVAVRRRLRGQTSSVWLDSAVGSLGAAAVLAVLLSPVVNSALTDSMSWATVVGVAYPMSDMVLVAAVAGITALSSMADRWGLLLTGLAVFAASDVVYALQVTAETYVVGTPLEAGWAIGLALVAMWADGTARRDESEIHQTRPATVGAALAVSSGATAAGLVVLVVGTLTELSTLAVTLAGTTLLGAAARAQLAFRLLARMAELRQRAAATDELTGLPNRRAFYDRVGARLEDPRRPRCALLMMDLDKFKEVNDSLGHHAGDHLLIEVGIRLGETLRVGDLLVRLGGDEFAVMLEDAGHDEAVKVAVQLREALIEPFAIEDVALHASASVGIALFPDDGPDLSTLLRKADIAMYKAKVSGHGGHHAYRRADDAEDTTRLQMVEELRTALANDQLVVHYQPKVDLDTGDVHSVEALVRWNHPTRGLLYPDAFLDLAERSGLMPTVTRVVLAQALDQVATWHAQGQPLTVAVNLAASSLVDSDFPEQVASMLAARELPPGALQLEITEEFLMADRARARAILTRLSDSGAQISVDDFGSGYSSLSYLRELPIDELKLDRSFILLMTGDRTAAVVASTIALAHSLGLRMVAEGVESHLAYTELTRLGCDQAQGFFMSGPVPAAEFDQWLSSRPGLDQGTVTPQSRSSACLG
jgi:diguanylate cyclase (GGDEF)-like protein